jgi:hypothetical protein
MDWGTWSVYHGNNNYIDQPPQLVQKYSRLGEKHGLVSLASLLEHLRQLIKRQEN